MLKKILIACLGVLALSQSLSAITIINQTDVERTIQIEEAYRPAPDQAGETKSPVPLLKESPKAVKIAAHSMQSIPLRTEATVLLVHVTEKTRAKKKVTTTKSTTCYEASSYQVYPDDENRVVTFTDEWGFVIHKPTSRCGYWTQQQGYGIMCFTPSLLAEVTSLDELPEELK